MADIAKVRLGQCQLTYNGQDLGYTSGGAEVTITNDVTQVAIDEYGSSPAKAFHKGTRIEAKVTLAEYSYEILQKILNGAQLVEGSATDAVTIGTRGGTALPGALLTMHPVAMGDDTDDDVDIYKAVVIGETSLPFKVDEETKYEVVFVALIDESKDAGSLLARFGVNS